MKQCVVFVSGVSGMSDRYERDADKVLLQDAIGLPCFVFNPEKYMDKHWLNPVFEPCDFTDKAFDVLSTFRIIPGDRMNEIVRHLNRMVIKYTREYDSVILICHSLGTMVELVRYNMRLPHDEPFKQANYTVVAGSPLWIPFIQQLLKVKSPVNPIVANLVLYSGHDYVALYPPNKRLVKPMVMKHGALGHTIDHYIDQLTDQLVADGLIVVS